MTNQQKSLSTAKQAELLLQQATKALEEAETHEQIQKASSQLRRVQGMVEQSEQNLYSFDERE